MRQTGEAGWKGRGTENMQCVNELERVIADGYAEGRTRFGDLGLDIHTYENRLKTIARDNLGE